jgi:hypothetical protein
MATDLEASLLDMSQMWRDAKPIMDFIKLSRDGWLELRQRLGMNVSNTHSHIHTRN